jgi:lipocalin
MFSAPAHSLGAEGPPPPSTVGHDGVPAHQLDLEKYEGTWYELFRTRASTPYEERATDVIATYHWQPNAKKLAVVNTMKVDGQEKTLSGGHLVRQGEHVIASKLSAKFPGIDGFSEYWVISVVQNPDKTYEYAVVSNSTRGVLWILSRTPHGDPARLRKLRRHIVDRELTYGLGNLFAQLEPTKQGDRLPSFDDPAPTQASEERAAADSILAPISASAATAAAPAEDPSSFWI